MRNIVWCAIGLGLLACGKNQVEDRVQVTPGEAPKARKPVVKLIEAKTEAHIEYVRFIEDEAAVNPLFPWKANSPALARYTTDLRCAVGSSGELGIVAQDKDIQLSVVVPGFSSPRFSSYWDARRHGTITYTDSIFSKEPEVVSFAEKSTCSIVATSDLKRIEGIIRCKYLEGFSKKENRKIAFGIVAKFNCPPARR